VHVDHRERLRFVSARLARRQPLPGHAEIDRLLSPLVESAEAIVADDPSSDEPFLKTFIIPDEPVAIARVYPGQAQACRGLLARYAEALGYIHAAEAA
jgi:hypothetical protein